MLLSAFSVSLLPYLFALFNGCHLRELDNQDSKYYADPLSPDKFYTLAELLFPARPQTKLLRMYPHVLPFKDMLHPSKRSYQYGFPDELRSGRSSQVPSEIVFYKVSSLAGIQSASSAFLNATFARQSLYVSNYLNWMSKRNAIFGTTEPVILRFSNLLSLEFDLNKDLLDHLGNETRENRLTTDSNYFYRDQIRGFLVGAWESMRQDNVLHNEENVWPRQPLKCADPADFVCFWRRFILIIISSKIDIQKSKVLQTPAIDTELHTVADTAGVAFWLFYCRMLHSLNSSALTDAVKELKEHYCPNPCRNNPCIGMAHTLTEGCTIEGDGMYDRDFRCTCKQSTFWSFSRKACVIYDRCKMNSPCSEFGSRSCQYDPLTSDLTCHCKAGFMGATCGEERDACFDRQPKELGAMPTGNRACNVGAGGHCEPVLGMDLYMCSCANGWIMDTGGVSHGSGTNNEIDPNCQRPPDPCGSLPCVSGDCVSSHGQAVCLCPVTHYGEKCETRRGLWSVWGPWSSCDPDCGDRRERYRVRSCLGLDCLGHRQESDWCPEGFVFCGVPEQLGVYGADRWRTAYALRQLLVGLAIATSVGMGCLLCCQFVLSLALRIDRSLLDSAVREKAHIHQLLAYHRLSYKTGLKLG